MEKDYLTQNYDQLIDSLSNKFHYNIFSNTPNIGLQYNKNKWSASLRLASSFMKYEQVNLTQHTKRYYNYISYNPIFSIRYAKNNFNSLSFAYMGKSTAPSLEQLQPTKINTDPLNLRIGNPNLSTSFLHDLSVNYQSFKAKSFRRLNLFVRYNAFQNSFVNLAIIENNVTTNQTINTNGVYSYSIGGNYNKPFNNFTFIIGVDPKISFNQGVNFIALNKKGVQKNKVQNTTLSLSLYVNKSSKKYSIELMPLFEYNFVKSMPNSAANTRFWSVT